MAKSKSKKLNPQTHRLLDDTFKTSVIVKGLDGVAEVIGAVVLLFIKPATVNHLVTVLTQHELSHDPRDIIASHLVAASTNFVASRLFGVFYLASHGIIKIVLVTALLKNKLWAYPATLAFLGLFILYQIYQIGYSHSLGLVGLTLFDVVVVWLVWSEYKLHKSPK